MKKSGSPTKPYMCTSDNPKMNSSNMGKGQGKGYYNGGLVLAQLDTGGFVPLPPTGRFIGTPNAPIPPVRPKPPAQSQPFGITPNSPPAGRFVPPPMGSSMRGVAPMQGMAPMQVMPSRPAPAVGGMQVMPPKTGPRPDYNNRQMNVLPPVVRTPAPMTVNEYVKQRKIPDKRA